MIPPKLESESEFHALWGQSKDSDDYDKKVWILFQTRLRAHDKLVADLYVGAEQSFKRGQQNVLSRLAECPVLDHYFQCDDGHQAIYHEQNHCPVCVALAMAEER